MESGSRPCHGSSHSTSRPFGRTWNGPGLRSGHEASVNESETLLRFARPQDWDADGMPSSAALSLKRGENGLSVYLNDLLSTRGLGPSDVIANRPGYGVFGMAAFDVISGGCRAELDPLTDDHPIEIGFAHGLVHPLDDKLAWKLPRHSLLANAVIKVAAARG